MIMYSVTPGLYRGPRPENGLQQIQTLGFKTIINLEDDIYELLHDDIYEQEQPLDFGLRPFRYRMSDWHVPDPDVTRQIIQTIEKENAAGNNVYLHCLHGEDRTGYVVAAYRMQIQLWSFDQAVAEMYKYGFHRFPYFYWVPSLRQFVVN
jgi:tyrosine-protein phosphatase SIW14